LNYRSSGKGNNQESENGEPGAVRLHGANLLVKIARRTSIVLEFYMPYLIIASARRRTPPGGPSSTNPPGVVHHSDRLAAGQLVKRVAHPSVLA